MGTTKKFTPEELKHLPPEEFDRIVRPERMV